MELGFLTVILAHTTFCFPFVMVTVQARLAGLDPSLEEAALDLGATPGQAFRLVILPYLLPAVIAGALLLKGTRLVKRGLPPGLQRAFALGAGASFVSTFGSTWLIRHVERGRSPLPYAIYRTALAGAVVRRLWQHRSR